MNDLTVRLGCSATSPSHFARTVGRAVVAIVLLAIARTASGQPGAPPAIVATPIVETNPAHAGTVRAALEITINDGLHIQSNKPRDPSLIPTALTFDLPADVTVTEIVFPPAMDFTLKGTTDALAVFEKTIDIGVQFAVAGTHPPGVLTVPAHLRYQACNDSACFPPKRADLSWTFTIVPTGTHVKASRSDVFARIAFGHGEVPPAAEASAGTTTAPVTARASTSATSNAADAVALLDGFRILGSTTGYKSATEFVSFIHDAENGVQAKGPFEGEGPLAIIALVFLGGLALNLTPCVLPMIPINLAIIGAGSSGGRRGRGFLLGGVYGMAMAVAYGLLGLVVILTAGSFGTINASPWFNVGIAVLFVFLGLAMFDVVSLDLSTYSSGIRFGAESRGTFYLAFAMGAVAALLAGACVAPVVVQVVVFSSNLYAGGTRLALGLPFVLGLGMALPWPIAGAGFGALPKPGAWMVRVKQAMGVFILASAAYYGYVAYGIFANRWVDPASVQASVNAQLQSGWYGSLGDGLRAAQRDKKPVILDLWATWCKNCLVMDETTMTDPAVTSALAGYTRIKFEAEDIDEPPARDVLKRVAAYGLPTYIILRPND